MLNENDNLLSVSHDPRFRKAMDLFNSQNWYKAHDELEDLWHETLGPERITIQALLQVAVAQVHLENGNNKGATILYGEGLGRLRKSDVPDLGLDIESLIKCLESRLKLLQNNLDPDSFKIPSILELK